MGQISSTHFVCDFCSQHFSRHVSYERHFRLCQEHETERLQRQLDAEALRAAALHSAIDEVDEQASAIACADLVRLLEELE